MSTTWGAVLDELEQRIDEAEAALDNGGDLRVDHFVPPTDIAPLPEALRERAIDVLRRQGELEMRLENTKAEIARELKKATNASRTKSPFSETKVSSFIDSRS